MPEILVHARNNGTPVNSLADPPEITIRRADTGVAVVTAAAMTDLGADGHYRYSFTPDEALDYAFQVDADPNATSQVTHGERYFNGGFPGEIDAQLVKVDELHRHRGLDTAAPLEITDTTIDAGAGIAQTIADDGTKTTVTRTP